MRQVLRSRFRLRPVLLRLPLVLGLILLVGPASLARAAAPVFRGTLTSPGLCSPRGVAVAPGGSVFVGSDCGSLNHMEQFSPSGALLATWPFPAPRYEGPPNGVAVDGAGNVYVTDMFNNGILKCTSAGTRIDSWGAGSAGASPVDLAVDGAGNVYAASMVGNYVRKNSPEGVVLGTFGGPGSTPGRFQSLAGVAVDGSGRVYGVDNSRVRVVRFLADGSFDMEFAPPSVPIDVAVGPEGNLYVISANGNQVHQYSPGGLLLQSFSSPLGFDLAYRIAIDSDGMIFISEQRTNRISKFQIDMTTPATPISFGRLKAMYR